MTLTVCSLYYPDLCSSAPMSALACLINAGYINAEHIGRAICAWGW